MKKKKILVLTSTFPRWANDTTPPFVDELSKRLTDRFEVTVLAPHYPGALPHEVRDDLTIYRFRYCWSRFEVLAGEKAILPALRANHLNYLLLPLFLLAGLFSAFRLVRKLRIDCIHAHWLLPQGLIAAIINVISSTPFLVTAHGGDVYGLQGWLPTLLKQFTLRRATRVTAVSGDLAARIHELVPGLDVSVIPMGVDATAFHPDLFAQDLRNRYKINGGFLLFVGRLSEKKGVRYLLEAMPMVVAQFPEVSLVIIGKGELDEELHGLTRQLSLAEHVTFTGAIPNHELPAYYATADLFIGPSITSIGGDAEGFGLTFVEAGLSGCLVIGTRTGGIGDIIEDGSTGFLVEQKSSEAISQAIIKGLNKVDQRKDLARRARKVLKKRFDWQVIANKYATLLDRV
ncbi:MAG: glycosyltransferase [Proteobacteria bacterium]|nr:glycosyltransferase [Pseudomonadota bacterium]MBU1688658.1 glycosyltransferase [Pseudomonadota bacterium]